MNGVGGVGPSGWRRAAAGSGRVGSCFSFLFIFSSRRGLKVNVRPAHQIEPPRIVPNQGDTRCAKTRPQLITASAGGSTPHARLIQFLIFSLLAFLPGMLWATASAATAAPSGIKPSAVCSRATSLSVSSAVKAVTATGTASATAEMTASTTTFPARGGAMPAARRGKPPAERARVELPRRAEAPCVAGRARAGMAFDGAKQRTSEKKSLQNLDPLSSCSLPREGGGGGGGPAKIPKLRGPRHARARPACPPSLPFHPIPPTTTTTSLPLPFSPLFTRRPRRSAPPAAAPPPPSPWGSASARPGGAAARHCTPGSGSGRA